MSPKTIDKTCLSYWFPKIEAAGLPVPETKIVNMSGEAFEDVFNIFDGKAITGKSKPFFDDIRAAAEAIGYPCFLRTGQTSGKHGWDRTCFLQSPEQVLEHVFNIVEYSEMAGIIGLPCDIWAVRKFLSTSPLATCPMYGNMPICREFRIFVDGSIIRCWHPYWPLEALRRGGIDDYDEAYSIFDQLCKEVVLLPDKNRLFYIASRAGLAVGGSWSVDILETEEGWYLTDMAEADKSFHWEGCELNKLKEKKFK